MEERIEDDERWLTDGDCSKCRRFTYCNKPCTRQKQRKAAILRRFVRSATGIGKIYAAMGDQGGMEE